MQTVAMTRVDNLSISEQLAEMHHWLDREGVQASDLGAERILNDRVTFAATVDRQGEADRLLETFSLAG